MQIIPWTLLQGCVKLNLDNETTDQWMDLNYKQLSNYIFFSSFNQ